jgi:hypothetical protein
MAGRGKEDHAVPDAVISQFAFPASNPVACLLEKVILSGTISFQFAEIC